MGRQSEGETVTSLGSHQTAGLICAHHHLYSSLARGMPAPPAVPTSFRGILENIWWRLDAALDLDTIYWSAALGALEAVRAGCTTIIDHHESPRAIEGSLDAIARACDDVGVRHVLAYGVTDRWQHGAIVNDTPKSMSDGARLGLTETERYVRSGGRAMVGVHASFTCSDETLEAAADLARRLGIGVHIHVAEGPDDKDASRRLAHLAEDSWLLVHCVHLEDELPGTIVHNPRSNMNNSVGYARPLRFKNAVVLGTDGIGADMFEEARVAYARLREFDVTATPDMVWKWLENSYALAPQSQHDVVSWNYDHMNEPWRLAFTPGVAPTDVVIDGQQVVKEGQVTTVDVDEIRARANESAIALHRRLEA
jgi:cytosine/adenosine deaminase-related metal-dependent hydrolase